MDKLVAKLDFFPTPISLLHKGRDKFATIYGAAYSVVAFIAVLVFTIAQFSSLGQLPATLSTQIVPITDQIKSQTFTVSGSSITAGTK